MYALIFLITTSTEHEWTIQKINADERKLFANFKNSSWIINEFMDYIKVESFINIKLSNKAELDIANYHDVSDI